MARAKAGSGGAAAVEAGAVETVEVETETLETGKAKAAKAKVEAVAEVKGGAVYVLQPGTPVYLKTADVCALFGKSNQWIGQLVSQGTLFKRRTARGNLFELHEAVKGYLDRLAERRAARETEDEDLESQKLREEIRLKQAKATIAALEVEELQGRLHRSEDVAAMTEDLVFAIRGALTAMPGRLAVDVLGVETAAEAAEIIRGEVNRVLETLADYRYDPDAYEERVRARRKLDAAPEDDPYDA